MGQWFSSTCPIWLTLNQSHQIHNQLHSDNNEPDERTPLIINPPPPRPPPQLVQDTAQQIADEAAANKIVDQTVRCLVHVYSQAPFSHLSVNSHSQKDDDRSHTPDGSTTTWRAYDPPSCPPISPEIRRLRLGYDQAAPFSNKSNQSTRLDQKQSYHSLKNMVKQSSRSDSSPSNTTPPLQSHPNPDQSSDLSSSSQDLPSHSTPDQSSVHSSSQDLQSHSQHLRDPTDASDYQCDTMTSFQTALEHTPSHEPSESLPSHTQPPEFVGKLWPNFHTTSPFQDPSGLEERNDGLTDDPQDLRALLDSGFTLKDTGPILVDL